MTAVSELCRNNLHSAEHRNSKGECKPCEDSARFARGESKVQRMKRLLSEAQQPKPGWQADALCGGADPTDWVLVDGRGKGSHAIEQQNRQRHERAKRVCVMCPVRKSCLGFALLGEVQQYGTWGAELLTVTDWEAARQARKEMAGE